MNTFLSLSLLVFMIGFTLTAFQEWTAYPLVGWMCVGVTMASVALLPFAVMDDIDEIRERGNR